MIGIVNNTRFRFASYVKRNQYCPVNLRGIGEKANSGTAFRMTKGVSDLNQK